MAGNLIGWWLRARREDRTRFHDTRRELYGRFCAAARDAWERWHALWVAAKLDVLDDVEVVKQPASGKLWPDLDTLFAEIEIVAAEPTVKAAADLRSSVEEIQKKVLPRISPLYPRRLWDSEEWQPVPISEMERAFIKAARKELGI